ncbi:MAG: YceI family protein [Crocinitomicaceae bacterium]
MKSLKNIILASSILILSAFTINSSINWTISEGYEIKFSSSTGDTEGIFKTINGDIQFDENDLTSSKFDFKVDVNSINTGNGMKNKHAISAKWFDAEKFPNIQFQSSKFSKTKTGYSVTGTMKMHGVNKEMTLPFTFSNNVFKSIFSVNRIDFNIGESMEEVSDYIKLEVSLPVAKK